jgi:hypothetical protein
MSGVPVPIPCPVGIVILQAPVVMVEVVEKRPGVEVPTATAIVRVAVSTVTPALVYRVPERVTWAWDSWGKNRAAKKHPSSSVRTATKAKTCPKLPKPPT